MAIKPILFNTEMVRAILDGRKDATRRIVKGFIPDDAVWGYTAFTPKGYISCRGTFADGYGEKFFKLPCEPGDILYVRETWCDDRQFTHDSTPGRYFYKASENGDFKWHTSIHMPKEAARIWLKVTDVRVERLQDMTDDDAEAEGCFDYTSTALGFFDVWDSTIKKSNLNCYGWNANPWVWVIKFERCEKPEE